MALKNNGNENDKILQKIRQFCAYRERCISEVLIKLKQLGSSDAEAAIICGALQKENFLNEKRFVTVFAGGKFRINKWGRQKIKAALIQKNIKPDLIGFALNEINDSEYEKTLSELLQKKMGEYISEKDENFVRQKLENYALQRGFEIQMIIKILDKILNKKINTSW